MPSLYDSFLKGKTKVKEWQKQFYEVQSLSNVFEENFITNTPEVFVPTRESHKLMELLGWANSTLSIIAIIGPKRSGKTSVVQQIVKSINENEEKKLENKDKIKAIYKAYDDKFWEWWEETDFESTVIFFFDNIYPIWRNFTEHSFQDLLKRSNKEKILIVVILDSIERHWLELLFKPDNIKIFGQEPFEFNFRRPLTIEIEEIITKRAEYIGKPNLLKPEVLNTISTLSFGLPGLALWITRHIISTEINKENEEMLLPQQVHRTTEFLGFRPALKLIIENNLRYAEQLDIHTTKEFWPILEPLKKSINGQNSPLLQYLTKIKSITNSWLPILEEMLLLTQQSGIIKRSELQERTGVKESSLTYQCQKLINEKIITYQKNGREVYYQLRSPVKEALELTLFG